MTATGAPDDRDVVPRWRAFGSTVRIGETNPSTRESVSAATIDLRQHEEAFRTYPGDFSASDLVGAALAAATRTDVAAEAANHLLGSSTASRTAASLALALVSDVNTPEIDQGDPTIDFERVRARSRLLKKIVRSEPTNAVRWADLALTHTVLGQPWQAEKEMRIALRIAGPHRFLLRAAARLYVHMELFDDAHGLLVAEPSLLDDPWIAAAELSTAAVLGADSKYSRRARKLLADPGRFYPKHISDLASQVATDELRAGNVKQAKRFMRLALVEPTDNTLAQAEWGASNGLGIEPSDLSLPRSYEAKALRYSRAGEWEKASAAGLDWLADQPFAQEAAQFTSYVASVGAMDWGLAEQAARAGLVANPHDSMLRNNLAFSLANQGKALLAEDELLGITQNPDDARQLAVLDATRGLVQFRKGNQATGRALYSKSVEAFVAVKDLDSAALAHVFWAREELASGSPEAGSVSAAAVERVKKAASPEAHLWATRLRELPRLA